MDEEELELTRVLLASVFDAPRFADLEFLDWVYLRNPNGEVHAYDTTRDGERICHIGGVPIVLRDRDGSYGVLSLLNSSTAQDKQSRGLWVSTLHELHDSLPERGLDASLGVTNSRSTKPAVEGGRYRYMGGMPVRVVLPLGWPGKVWSAKATPEVLASDRFAEVTADVSNHPSDGLEQVWSTELLRWRLGFPGSTYWIHASPTVVAVTTRTTFKGVRVVVVLKLLPRRAGPVRSATPVVTAACLHHRTPFAIHAGWNEHVTVRGIPVGHDRLPAPLNLVFKSYDPSTTESSRFGVWEFLDFDAY